MKQNNGWRLPDELWTKMEPLLPPRPPHPFGKRSTINQQFAPFLHRPSTHRTMDGSFEAITGHKITSVMAIVFTHFVRQHPREGEIAHPTAPFLIRYVDGATTHAVSFTA